MQYLLMRAIIFLMRFVKMKRDSNARAEYHLKKFGEITGIVDFANKNNLWM